MTAPKGCKKGESRYKNFVYCPNCIRWIPKKLLTGVTCPECGTNVRFGPRGNRARAKRIKLPSEPYSLHFHSSQLSSPSSPTQSTKVLD